MHILIFRFSALGDVALTVPVVASLSAQYPEHRFTVISRPFVAPLFEGLGANVAFKGVDLNAYKGMAGLLRLAYQLKREMAADAVADLHDVLRTKVLRAMLRLAGLRVAVICKGRADRRRLIDGSNRRPLPHVTERYAEVFARLGLPVHLSFAGIAPEAWQPKDERTLWIGVAPFAAHQGKIYPLEKMTAAVGLLLKRNPVAQLFVFGAPSEMATLRPVWRSRRIRFVCDSIKGLGNELRLMRQLDVMISMDSANLHLASLVATPVVSLWGATHPYAGFTGYGQREETIVQLPLSCRPCSIYGNKPCRFGDWHCLSGIAPERVVETVERVLHRAE